MGNDLCRGFLSFSNGKPLGPNGLNWLKIHLANKLGNDKISFKARIEFIDGMMDKIKKTIEDPFKNDWWLNEDDCWQSLATMKELDEASKMDNPEEYIRSLFV